MPFTDGGKVHKLEMNRSISYPKCENRFWLICDTNLVDGTAALSNAYRHFCRWRKRSLRVDETFHIWGLLVCSI